MRFPLGLGSGEAPGRGSLPAWVRSTLMSPVIERREGMATVNLTAPGRHAIFSDAEPNVPGGSGGMAESRIDACGMVA